MISKSKLATLKYWAHAGASSSTQAQNYRKQFPNRLDPYYRVRNAIEALETIEVPKRIPIGRDNSIGKDEHYCTWFCCPSCESTDIARGYNYCPNCGIVLDWED